MNREKISEKLLRNPISLMIRKALIFLLTLMIRLYQYVISPVLPDSCRFTPTCSKYSLDALKTHGVFKGLVLSAWRILRCNPWGGHGYDPVPPQGTWRSPKNIN